MDGPFVPFIVYGAGSVTLALSHRVRGDSPPPTPLLKNDLMEIRAFRTCVTSKRWGSGRDGDKDTSQYDTDDYA